MLDVAVDNLKADKQIGMVALKVRDVTGPHTSVPYLGTIWESGVLNCNQGMLPTALLRELGGFNEEFRDYGIDADLTTRVLLAGCKVVYTKAEAIHHYRNHEADNWTTKSNRGHRLQLARQLYRKSYPKLVPQEGVPLYFHGKLSKNFKIIFEFLLKYLLNRAVVGPWAGSFFRDCYNVLYGRFISRWDLFENLQHSYYLVQQMPESLRLQSRAAENPN
jgi:GT2 family glycosyltransferase